MSIGDALQRVAADWHRVRWTIPASARLELLRVLEETARTGAVEPAATVIDVLARWLPADDPVFLALTHGRPRGTGVLLAPDLSSIAGYVVDRINEEFEGPAPEQALLRSAKEALEAAPLPDAPEVNELLHAASDPWGVRSWWHRWNGWLGCAPVELVGTERAPEVVEAARQVFSDSW